MLKVRIVEMQRSVIKQLGFNLNALIGQAGRPQFLLGAAATFGVNGAILGGLNARVADRHHPAAGGVRLRPGHRQERPAGGLRRL